MKKNLVRGSSSVSFASLFGCSLKMPISLKEYTKNRDLDLIEKEVLVSLAGKNAVEQEILFSFHPDLKRLFFIFCGLFRR